MADPEQTVRDDELVSGTRTPLRRTWWSVAAVATAAIVLGAVAVGAGWLDGPAPRESQPATDAGNPAATAAGLPGPSIAIPTSDWDPDDPDAGWMEFGETGTLVLGSNGCLEWVDESDGHVAVLVWPKGYTAAHLSGRPEAVVLSSDGEPVAVTGQVLTVNGGWGHEEPVVGACAPTGVEQFYVTDDLRTRTPSP